MTSRPSRAYVETRERILDKDELYQGVTLPAGTRVAEGTTGAIHYWWPALDITVDGITVIAGTQLDPPQNGHLRALWTKKGQRLHDLVIDENGVWVTFDARGLLDTIMFKRPTTVRGLLVQHHVQFHPVKGAPIKRALLVEPATIGGVGVPKGELHLDERGGVLDQNAR